MMIKMNQRLDNAKEDLLQLEKLGPSFKGFEKTWYSFLLNFNGFFTVLEQASKSNQKSMKWYSEIRNFRKSDPILSYLQHARNMEEHHGVSSIMRSGFIAKPKAGIKGTKIAYRDNQGNPLNHIQINLTQGMETNIKIIPPRIRFRSVVDCGKVYDFPTKYSHPVLEEMVKKGVIDINSKAGSSVLKIAIYHAEIIRSKANELAGV